MLGLKACAGSIKYLLLYLVMIRTQNLIRYHYYNLNTLERNRDLKSKHVNGFKKILPPNMRNIVTALRLTKPSLISNHYHSSYMQDTIVDVKEKVQTSREDSERNLTVR